MAAAIQTGVNHEDGQNVFSSGSKGGFFGVATPVVQPTNAAQAALTLTTSVQSGSAVYGFSSKTAMDAVIAQLENIRASLVALGLLAGS
jgi:hypothetical protein